MPLTRSAAMTPPLNNNPRGPWGVEVHCDGQNRSACWSNSVNGVAMPNRGYDNVAQFGNEQDAWTFVRALSARGVTCWPGMNCTPPKTGQIKKLD